MVALRTGELFYLRALLLHRAASSFVDLRTIDGHLFSSFHEAACDLGLFNNGNEGFLTMQEAVQCLRTPSQLRFLFAQIILEGYPAMPLWLEFRDHISEDHSMFPTNKTLAFDYSLQKIAHHLSYAGRSLTDFGLPNPTIHSVEIEKELLFLAENQPCFCTEFAQLLEQLNDEQLRIFYEVRNLIDNPDSECRNVFLEGRPGRGKTFLIKTLLSSWQAKGKIVIIVGTSALSATAYSCGHTAHYMFGIPVNDECVHLHSKISPSSARADLMRSTYVIIWDKLPMANKAAWECVHDLCCKINSNDSPFGNIAFIGAGDFRQVAPVISGCGESATLAPSVKSSNLWLSMKILSLQTSMRCINDAEYTSFVDAIGEDISDARHRLPFLRNTMNIMDVVDFLFPDEVLNMPHLCLSRAFLSPRNIFIDEFNDNILNHLPSAACMSSYCTHLISLTALS